MFRSISNSPRGERRTHDSSPKRFYVESLESRILLNADPLTAALGSDLLPQEAPVVLKLEPGDLGSLQPLFNEALEEMKNLGFDQERLDQARNVPITVVDLPEWTIAESTDQGIQIDVDAAGFGWYIDSSPAENTGFHQNGTDLVADPGTPATDMSISSRFLLTNWGITSGSTTATADSCRVIFGPGSGECLLQKIRFWISLKPLLILRTALQQFRSFQ